MLQLAEKGLKIVIMLVFVLFKKLNRVMKDIFNVPNQTFKDENYNV